MGLFDFFKKKKKQEDTYVSGSEELVTFDDVDPAEINPPETRFTQEYQDFLAAQEEPSRECAPAAEASAESEAEFEDDSYGETYNPDDE